MPAKIRTDKVAEAITPIATRVAKDPELREHAKAVLDSAKAVLDRVQNEGARSAAGRKDVQDEVVRAAREIKHGAARLAAKPLEHKSKKRRAAKAAAAGAVAVGAVVVARRAMSKDEDEFEYTP